MAKHDTLDLAGETNLLIVTSTYGDGEPPDGPLLQRESLFVKRDEQARLRKVRRDKPAPIRAGDHAVGEHGDIGGQGDGAIVGGMVQLALREPRAALAIGVQIVEAAKRGAIGEVISHHPAAKYFNVSVTN